MEAVGKAREAYQGREPIGRAGRVMRKISSCLDDVGTTINVGAGQDQSRVSRRPARLIPGGKLMKGCEKRSKMEKKKKKKQGHPSSYPKGAILY